MSPVFSYSRSSALQRRDVLRIDRRGSPCSVSIALRAVAEPLLEELADLVLEPDDLVGVLERRRAFVDRISIRSGHCSVRR